MVRRTNFPGILVPRNEILPHQNFRDSIATGCKWSDYCLWIMPVSDFMLEKRAHPKVTFMLIGGRGFKFFRHMQNVWYLYHHLPPLYKIPIPMPLVTLTQTARSYVLLCHRSVSIVSLWLYCHQCSGSSQPVAVITCFSVAIATAFPFNIGLLYLCNSFLATSIPCIPTDMGGRKFQLDMHCKRREEIWWMKCYLTP